MLILSSNFSQLSLNLVYVNINQMVYVWFSLWFHNRDTYDFIKCIDDLFILILFLLVPFVIFTSPLFSSFWLMCLFYYSSYNSTLSCILILMQIFICQLYFRFFHKIIVLFINITHVLYWISNVAYNYFTHEAIIQIICADQNTNCVRT